MSTPSKQSLCDKFMSSGVREGKENEEQKMHPDKFMKHSKQPYFR